MHALLLPLTARFFVLTSVVAIAVILLFADLDGYSSIYVVIPLILFTVLALIGIHDIVQTRHAVLRNYPLMAHIRFILEEIRPEIRQYFLESEKDGTPFSRDNRALVYQRAKKALDKRPFGTQNDVYASGYEWLDHSIAPKPVVKEPFRVVIGGPDCGKLYSASIFNISAMSFGALSPNAIRALNIGAKKFAENAKSDQIKMVELKLSQGAKPGHGGVLPAAKVSAEIAATRGVPEGVDCISPSRHSAFSTPIEMMQFIATMRKLSGGKPVGFKL